MAAVRKVPAELLIESFSHWVDRYTSVLRFLSGIVVAGFLKLLYRAQRGYYVQHLIFALHIFTFEFLLRILLMGAHDLAGRLGHDIGQELRWGICAVLVPYLYLSLQRVYGESPQRTLWKTVVLALLCWMLIFVVIYSAYHLAFTTV